MIKERLKSMMININKARLKNQFGDKNKNYKLQSSLL